MDRSDNIALIFAKLSKDSQRYLLNMAMMASVAEKGAIKEISKSVSKKENDDNEKIHFDT